MPDPMTTTWHPSRPVDVLTTLAPHRRGPYDPTFAPDASGAVWRTCRPDGQPATVRLAASGPGAITITAWGPGAESALAGAPGWLGAHDDLTGFEPRHPAMAAALRRHPSPLVGRTGLVFEALVPAILEQKVTTIEAHRSWAALLRRHGEPAPGPAPAGMRVVPSAGQWARIPSWDWHRAGVDPRRARTVVTAAGHARALAAVASMTSEAADRRLQAVPGIGAWTSAEVRQRVLGDADAVSVGDSGLPNLVAYALAGERRADDARMLELLEPYAGHRHRACWLLWLAGPWPPRRAPRAPLRDYRDR